MQVINQASFASQLDQAIQTTTELRSKIEQLQATLDQEISRSQQAIQTIEQRLDQAEQRNTLQLDRDTLIKRLKQNRQITIALTFMSLISFVMAAIALFR